MGARTRRAETFATESGCTRRTLLHIRCWFWFQFWTSSLKTARVARVAASVRFWRWKYYSSGVYEGFQGRRFRNRLDKLGGTIFGTPCPIPAQRPAVSTRSNEFDKMTQKKPSSTVETYNFLLLHANFFRSVRVRSFARVVWKKLADYFVAWKLKGVSNFFIGQFFIGPCAYARLISRL